MIIIGEKVNVMMKVIGNAIKERDKKPIQEMALLQAEGGANWLDINLGPATKEGPEKMRFVVEAVQARPGCHHGQFGGSRQGGDILRGEEPLRPPHPDRAVTEVRHEAHPRR